LIGFGDSDIFIIEKFKKNSNALGYFLVKRLHSGSKKKKR